MPHLFETLRNQKIKTTITELESAHHAISETVANACKHIDFRLDTFGSDFKRLLIPLPKHPVIGKDEERLIEIVNILATVEKTIGALIWFGNEFPGSWLNICHPSTSDSDEGNDIVLLSREFGETIVRCEITDVISSNAGQNGKEAKDLKSLSCENEVPLDGVRRFIATSNEYSKALCSHKRKWSMKHYHYVCHSNSNDNATVILEIKSS